jgi:phenylalanyl-tRNA synthetase beta chain
VFIECALFDHVRIAQTGQRHGIFSDARQRFERGIDSQLLPEALDAATSMVLALCGGEASDVSEAGSRPEWTREANLRFSRLKSFGGSEIGADEAASALQRLGFGVLARDAQQVKVRVPSWRNDIAQPPVLDQADLPGATKAAEGAAQIEPEVDLIEEVLRAAGMRDVQLPRP